MLPIRDYIFAYKQTNRIRNIKNAKKKASEETFLTYIL